LINRLGCANWSRISWIDAWTRGLLFLFPLFAVSVRHWLSIIFTLLCILGIYNLFRRKYISFKIDRDELILMFLLAAFFFSFLLTSLSTGWDEQATRALGTELRFLLFIPLYFLVRQEPEALLSLAWGCLFAVFLNFGLTVYEVEILGVSQVHGIYSSLFIGPITIIFLAVALFTFRKHDLPLGYFLPIAALTTTGYVAAYTSRSALLALTLLSLFYYLTTFKKHRFAIFTTSILILSAIFYFNQFASSRTQTAYDEFVAYSNHELTNKNEINPYGGTSIGVRLEMMKASKFVLQDFPWLGFGRYNYEDYMSNLVDKGLLHNEVAKHSHPHNMLLTALFFKGFIGISIVISIFGYSIFYFWRNRIKHKTTSLTGLAFLLVLFVTQMTESAILIKGNFIAVFLVFLAVLYSNITTERRINLET